MENKVGRRWKDMGGRGGKDMGGRGGKDKEGRRGGRLYTVALSTRELQLDQHISI